MDKSVAPATAKSYRSAMDKWMTHCQGRGISGVPAEQRDVAEYMAKLAEETQSFWAVKTFCSALAFEHDKQFYQRPTDAPAVRRVLAGIQRQHKRPRDPVRPMSKEKLHEAIRRFLGSELGSGSFKASLTTWRTVWRMTVEFYGMLRFSEVQALTSQDVRMGHSQEGSYMAILIRRSKTDQEGSGSEVFVQAQPSLGYLCPVFITQRYFRRREGTAAIYSLGCEW